MTNNLAFDQLYVYVIFDKVSDSHVASKWNSIVQTILFFRQHFFPFNKIRYFWKTLSIRFRWNIFEERFLPKYVDVKMCFSWLKSFRLEKLPSLKSFQLKIFCQEIRFSFVSKIIVLMEALRSIYLELRWCIDCSATRNLNNEETS